MTFDNLIALHEMLWEDTNLEQQIKKWEEEYDEWYETDCNSEEELYELADMIIVSAGIARFDYPKGLGYLKSSLMYNDMSKLWQAVEKKMEKNRKRVWNKTADGLYHHENGIED